MKLNEILKVEASVATMINDLKNQIVNEVAETPLANVTVLSKNTVSVKMSMLSHNVWSPEYYIPGVQAEYVKKALNNITTAHSFVKKIEEMIEKSGVKIGPNLHRFNDTTISILKKHYAEIN